MRPHRLLVVPSALAAVVALSTSPASAASKTPASVATPGQLVYVSNHGDYDLWTVNADGSGRALLTKSTSTPTSAWNSAKTEWAPVFSPDRQWLAYQTSRSGTPDVAVRNAVTGAYLVVAGRPDRSEAPIGWYVAADGPRVAYVLSGTTAGGPYELRSVRADGTGDVALLDGSYDVRSLAATADTVYVSLLRDGSVSIWSFPASTDPASVGAALSRVTTGHQDINVAVSAVGDVVFMRANADRSGDLYTLPPHAVEANGVAAALLVHQGFNASNPELSPDGTRIAFSSAPDDVLGHSDVYVAPVTRGSDGALHAGAARLVVGDSTYQDSQPTWSR